MKKCDIIKNNRDFDYIISNGNCVRNQELIIYYVNNQTNNHFGISVGKKIGNAVTRNYYKRIMRDICDKCKNIYLDKRDYIIIVRKTCANLSYEQIKTSFIVLVNKINNIEKERKNEKNN